MCLPAANLQAGLLGHAQSRDPPLVVCGTCVVSIHVLLRTTCMPVSKADRQCSDCFGAWAPCSIFQTEYILHCMCCKTCNGVLPAGVAIMYTLVLQITFESLTR